MVNGGGPGGLSIFVCYRREDDPFLPGRLSDSLTGHFGEGNVFYDIDAIQPGFDFRDVIRDRLAEVDAVLVLIGHEWDTARLGEHNDFVRTEMLEALRMKKLLIPILVGSATMPTPDQFPHELEPVAYLNAARIRPDPDFDSDSARLISAIEHGVGARKTTIQPVPDPEPDPKPKPKPQPQPQAKSDPGGGGGGGGDPELDRDRNLGGGGGPEPPPPPIGWWERWRGAVLGAAAAVVLVGVIVGAVVLVGGNDEDDSVDDAIVSTSEPEVHQVEVSGTKAWTDTGIDVVEGDRVAVKATGVVVHDSRNGIGPVGFPNIPELVTPLPSENHAGLLGRVTEQGDPFYIGAGTTFTAAQSGRFELGINDGFLGDNRGAFEATVAVSNGDT